MLRQHVRSTILMIFLPLAVSVSVLFAQQGPGPYQPGYNPNPKTADGKLDDWGNGQDFDNSLNYNHLYQNEAQFLHNGEKYNGGFYGKPGGPEDEPLNQNVVDPTGIPMGSGFNLVSALAAYDPTYKGGTYWVAFDLPGPTNDHLSEGFPNLYWLNNGVTLYPVPFDVDCNQDPDVVDFGKSIINSSVVDNGLELYEVRIWVGGDYLQGWNYNGTPSTPAPYTGPGFPIIIQMSEDQFQPFTFKAFVPDAFTKQSGDLDLVALGLVTHSDPAGPNPDFDIEVEVNGIWEKILPEIDQTAPTQPVTFSDLYQAYLEFFADSNQDLSQEERVNIGLNAPRLPMEVEVEKKVVCGECDGTPGQSSFPGDKVAFALPGSNVKFYVKVTIPKASSDPKWPANGPGFVRGKDVIAPMQNFTGFELCADEITVDGQTGLVKIPNFDVSNTEWIITEPDGQTPYLFNPLNGDIEVKIPFRVTTDAAFNTPSTPIDLTNTVEVWGDNGESTTQHKTDSADVNLLLSEVTCGKVVEGVTATGKHFGPGTNVSVDVIQDDFPITVTWTLTGTNTGETRVHLDADAFSDPALCLIPDLTGTPFCNGSGITPMDLDPTQSKEVKIDWIIDTPVEYWNAVTILFNNGYGSGNEIFNQFHLAATVVVNVNTPNGPVFICHQAGGQNVAAYSPECDSNEVHLQLKGTDIGVIKTVACEGEPATSPDLAHVLPGADVVFTLTVTNTGLSPHEHTWFKDDLMGAACSYAGGFQILTPGFTISPANFQPDGTLFEILPPLDIGQSVTMTFKATADPNYHTMGVSPECVNTLTGEADGPDPDTVPEVSDQDTADVDILVPEIQCGKLVKVTTQDGTYGPSQNIDNIPRTDGYNWQVEWTITLENTGETWIDGKLTDALIENWTSNSCMLPIDFSLQPGGTLPVTCTEAVADYGANHLLDINDVDGFDDFVHNVSEGVDLLVDVDPPSGDHLCHTHDGGDVPALTPDPISCDAKYNAPPPCGAVEIVDKGVSCVENGPFTGSVKAVPGADVYFRFEVKNPSQNVALDHLYVKDTLTGPYTDFTAIQPPGFQLNKVMDLGPVAPGASIVVKYKVRTDPDYNQMGVSPEIVNQVEAWADGPDADPDPDPLNECPDAYKILEKGEVDIVIPAMKAEKNALAVDDDGNVYPPSGNPGVEIFLDSNTAYPVEVTYTLTITNTGEITLDPVEVTDQVLENLKNGIPPGIDIVCNPDPPWQTALNPGDDFVITCVVTLDTFDEAELLASNDLNPDTKDTIENQGAATSQFDPDACGEVNLDVSTNLVRIHIKPVQQIPALDEWGLALLALALGGLILWRSLRSA